MAVANVLPDWLGSVLAALAAGEIDRMVAAYAEDAVHEFPFSEDEANRLAGHAAIAAYMGGLGRFVRFGRLGDVRVREAGDEVIVEATGHHVRLPDETPFALGCVWFITRRDGLITHWRDYMNPLGLRPR